MSTDPTATGPVDVENVWRELHDSLLAFIRRRVRSREVAEDILQDVMLRIHRHAFELQEAGSVAAWVYRITYTAIADHYRDPRLRRELAAGIDLGDEPGATGRQVEAPDMRAKLACCMRPLLARLPAAYREALTLTELQGLSQASAAAQVGLSVPGMKSRVQRGRRLLKRSLIECCEIELDRRRGIMGYRPHGGSCPCDVR